MIRNKKLLDINDLEQSLSVKKSHLRSLIFRKQIPFLKLGRLIRFCPVEIEKWLMKSKTEVTSD